MFSTGMYAYIAILAYVYTYDMMICHQYKTTEKTQIHFKNMICRYTLGNEGCYNQELGEVPFWPLFIFYLLVKFKGSLVGSIYT